MAKFSRFDAADYLDDEDTIAEYITAALEDPNPAVFLAAVRDVARARGMAQLAKDAGLGRESLDCLRTLHQIAPELLQAGSTRQTRRHAHDGHGARINLRSFAHFNPPPDIGGLRKRLKA